MIKQYRQYFPCQDCNGRGYWDQSVHGSPEFQGCGSCQTSGVSPEGRKQLRWDHRFLDLAALISSWSKDPSTKCGAVIVRDDRSVASLGYNGFPRGVDDRPERLNDRPEKLGLTVHAEMNAILHLRERADGMTLYTWPFLTCDRCAVHVVQAGIRRVVCPVATAQQLERWGEAFERTRRVYQESRVRLMELPLDTVAGLARDGCRPSPPRGDVP